MRITHPPTGIVVSRQNEKSQLQNKEQALRIPRSRFQAAQGGGGRRGGRGTTQPGAHRRPLRADPHLQLPENRISDHRTGYSPGNLDQVLDGDLQPVLDSCVDADLRRPPRGARTVTTRRELLREAAARLRDAGVASPITTRQSSWPTCSAPRAPGSRWSSSSRPRRSREYDGLVTRRAAREPCST